MPSRGEDRPVSVSRPATARAVTAKRPEGDEIPVYEIRVKGHLDGSWSEWFEGLEISNLEGGEAVLSGEIVDQAALHGVLSKVRDLNVPLISVSGVAPGQQDPTIRQAKH